MPDFGTVYAKHEAFIAPARARPELWRLLIGLGLGAIIMSGLNLALISLASFLLGPGKAHVFLVELDGATTPMSTLYSLTSFGCITIGVLVAIYVMHDRNPLTVLGPIGPAVTAFCKLMQGLIVLYALLFVLPPWSMGAPLIPNLEFSSWIALLPFSLIAVLIQSSAEEVLFRGYIQQQLAVRFSSRWVWMGVPSVLFGLGHYIPAEAGENALLIALWASIFGLLMADLTARAGHLGPAIAVHFITNISALLLTSLPDTLSGLALFTAPFGLSNVAELRAWLIVDYAMIIVCWLVARLALRR
ncbi:MAG: CPBP family intramembrane glutamic endopeptidase [Paracoccaceae bacterium]